MKINESKLKEDLMKESYGAGFVGRFGGAFAEACEIENASGKELADIAKRNGIDISDYEE